MVKNSEMASFEATPSTSSASKMKWLFGSALASMADSVS
jgi:hypothetical protein